MTVLQDAWDSLRREDSPTTGWLTRRVHADACLPIRAAISAGDRTPAVLFDVSAASIQSVVEYPTAKGFAFAPEVVSPGPTGRVRLCLSLRDLAYIEQFPALASDIVAAAVDSADEARAVAVIFSRLHAWQSFLQKHADGLSVEEQTGLFAELLFLTSTCAPVLGPAVLDCWKGPLGGVRDFLVRRVGVEIKATALPGTMSFRVYGLSQLDESGLDHLFVCACRLAVDDGGISLPELVARARRLFQASGPAVISHFNHLLLVAGYSDLHEARYQRRRLFSQPFRYYRVQGNFPRLTVRNVPDGVTDVSYSVSTMMCEEHQVAEESVLALMRDSG